MSYLNALLIADITGRVATVTTDLALKVDGSAVTQPVAIQNSSLPVTQGTSPWLISAASLPLPTGASTEATLAAINGKITAVNTGAVVLANSTAEIGNVKNSGTFAVQAAQSGSWSVGITGDITLANTDFNIAKYGGSDVGAGNAFYVRPGTGAAFDVNITNPSLSVTQGTSPWIISAASLPLPAGAATSALQTAGNTSLSTLAGGVTAGVYQTNITNASIAVTGTFWQATQPISAVSLPLPALAATSTKQSDGTQKTQIVDGSGNVIGATSNALNVNITNTVPISGTITANQGTSPWVVSGTVTANAGTNLNTSLLALESGGNLATLAAGVTASVYQSNVNQINGITPLMGNGVTGTGSQRVTIASDNTAFGVNANQAGTWNITNISGTVSLPTGAATAAKQPALGIAGTASSDVLTVQGIASMTALKVDGSAATQPVSQSGNWSVRAQDGAGNALTSNSATYTAKFGLDTNLLGTLGTAFSTAGFVDIKGADGNVFVRNATAANLLATVNNRDGAGNALTSNSTATGSSFALDSNFLAIKGTAVVTGGASGLLAIAGNVGAQATDSANPVKIGGFAINAEQTLATNGQRQNIVTDLTGRTITFPFSNKENMVSGTATTTGTSDVSLIASAGGSLRNYLTAYTIYNSGATAATITFKNGSGGATLWTDFVPAGGRVAFTLPSPVFTSAATALYFAAGSSSTTIGVAASGFKGT